MKWSEMFSKSQGIDVSGKSQMSIKDVMEEFGQIHITDFSFIKTGDGDTAFVLFSESPDSFFFAPQVLTTMLNTIADNDDAMEKFKAEGITVAISTTKNKKGNRTYFNFTPVDDDEVEKSPKKKTTKKK